ncbi:thioredoxin [Tenuifilum thalassicum]|uniref:Thioredoxin n=2 Tax=Tenuifilum thalassicum TaxID=2590900 RepID=A0A7D4BLU1_9BACT|nr:thioredoxin [Tenuifilum thalassicum]
MKNVENIPTSQNIIHLTDKNFANITRNGVTIVDFWAEWCTPCKMLVPVMNEIADELKGQVKVGKLNVETSRQVAARYNIRNIPTVIIFKNGKEVKRLVGVKPKNTYLKELKSI